MAVDLIDYLKTHECKGFAPVPHYFPSGDYLTYHFRDDRAVAERVDDLLTVYVSATRG